MKHTHFEEIAEISGAICERTATDVELNRLETILAGDTAAQQVYFAYMSLHSELFWQQDSVLPPFRKSSFSQSKGPAPHRPSVAERAPWWFALAAMLMLGGGLGLAIASHFRQSPSAAVAERPQELDPTAEQVATITGTRNCRWHDSGGAGSSAVGFGSAVFAGQQLELVEGLAEVTFETGVRIILEAPAKLDFSSERESVLHTGRMTASVPPGAEGFQVACRGITLVDRGTEFGVNSTDSGETEVHVFDGLVEGHLKDPQGSTFRTVSWSTNEFALFDPGKQAFRNVAAPSSFVRSLSQSANSNNGLFASEDFDYPVGPISGHNGGFGWGGPWETLSAAGLRLEANRVGAGSIPFVGLQNSGNHLLLRGQYNRIRRILATSLSSVFDVSGLTESQDGARLIGRDNTTIYLSFSQRVSKLKDGFYGVELNRGDGNANRVICFGRGAAKAWVDGPPRAPDGLAGFTDWSVTSEFNGRDNQLREYGSLGVESIDPVFVLVRIDFGPQDRDALHVFVNPRSQTDLESPDVSGEGNFAFDRIGIANFEGDKSYEVDHLKIGNTFEAVGGKMTRPVSASANQ